MTVLVVLAYISPELVWGPQTLSNSLRLFKSPSCWRMTGWLETSWTSLFHIPNNFANWSRRGMWNSLVANSLSKVCGHQGTLPFIPHKFHILVQQQTGSCCDIHRRRSCRVWSPRDIDCPCADPGHEVVQCAPHWWFCTVAVIGLLLGLLLPINKEIFTLVNTHSSSFDMTCDMTPVDKWRNNTVIITSKGRRFDVIITLPLWHVFVGRFSGRNQGELHVLLYILVKLQLRCGPFWLLHM